MNVTRGTCVACRPRVSVRVSVRVSIKTSWAAKFAGQSNSPLFTASLRHSSCSAAKVSVDQTDSGQL
jgi:hypothetical protein